MRQCQGLGSARHRGHWRPNGEVRVGHEGGSTTKIGWCGAVRGDPASRQIHLGDFAMLCKRDLAIFVLQCVNMHRSVRGLGRDVFVERVPCHALYVVVVLGNLPYNAACAMVSKCGQFDDDWAVPVCALYMRAMLSILPVIKKMPSGDQARS